MKGVIYTRVSSDAQIDGMSLTFQREDCLTYAQKNGIEVIHMFEERGESAKFADRPQLLELLAFCRKKSNRVNVVIVWKLDRLSRNQMDYYFIKRTLYDRNIAIHSATEPSLEDSSSIAARVFETFSALQAEIDNTMRRERVLRGMAARIASGIYPWKPPLGYCCARHRLRGEKKTEPDEPDPGRFPIVERVFRTCLTERIGGSVELARLANAWGLRTETGKPVYPQLIDRMLGNPFYGGILVDPWSKVTVRGRHQAVLSAEEFERLQRLRKGEMPDGPVSRRAVHPDFPLRKTIRCPMCSSWLTGSWSRGNGGRYPYYHCPRKGCELYGKGIPKAELEHSFRQKLGELAVTERARTRFVEAVVETWRDRTRLSAQTATRQRAKLRDIEGRLDRLIGMKERDLLSDEEFRSRKVRLSQELVDVRESLAQLHDVPGDVERLARDAMAFVGTMARQWDRMEPELRRRFQASVFPDGVPYRRNVGFGTARLGLIYETIGRAETRKSRLVRLVGASWNQVIDALQELLSATDPDLADDALPYL